MKKVITLVVILFSLCLSGMGVRFGGKFGASIGSIRGLEGSILYYEGGSGSVGVISSSYNSVTYGVIADTNTPYQNIALQGEINYLGKGACFGFSDWGDDSEYVLSMKYLEFTVLVKYYFPSKSNSKWGAYFGPSYALLRKAQLEGYDNSSEDLGAYMNDGDVSLNMGIIMELSNTLLFDFRYNWGMTANEYKIFEGFANNEKFKTQNFIVSIGVLL